MLQREAGKIILMRIIKVSAIPCQPGVKPLLQHTRSSSCPSLALSCQVAWMAPVKSSVTGGRGKVLPLQERVARRDHALGGRARGGNVAGRS